MPSMLDIVAGHRDRLRERVGELEQERKRSDTLHADNVRLLERTKYLQSFRPQQNAGKYAPGRRGTDADLEGRYGAAYEESLGALGPVAQFRQDEKARRVAQMNFGER